MPDDEVARLSRDLKTLARHVLSNSRRITAIEAALKLRNVERPDIDSIIQGDDLDEGGG